MSLIDLMIDKT